MINSIPRTACSLAGLLLLIPAAFAQQQRTSPSHLDVDAAVSEIRIEVDLTGQLQVSGVRAERVRVQASSSSVGGLPDCPLSLQQDGDIVKVTMSTSGGCKGDVDLQVYVPRRFSATLLALKAREVVVHDLDGRVSGEVSPDLECHFSFRGSASCAGGKFDISFTIGEFAMRAQSQK